MSARLQLLRQEWEQGSWPVACDDFIERLYMEAEDLAFKLAAADTATETERQEVQRLTALLQAMERSAPPPGPSAPTEADEPPWEGWFSCEDCGGWFNAVPVAYDSGAEVCNGCAAERDRRLKWGRPHEPRGALARVEEGT